MAFLWDEEQQVLLEEDLLVLREWGVAWEDELLHEGCPVSAGTDPRLPDTYLADLEARHV